MTARDSTRIPPAQPFPRIDKGNAIITMQEMVEALLWDFAKRAQQDEERAYQQSRQFIEASEKVSDERLDLLLRRIQ
jgi:hypothetical protein